MREADNLFSGNAPEIYDRYLVPLIFEPYARDLANRVTEAAPKVILEIAAGTGALTREIAARLPQGSRIFATDLNRPMLDQAAAKTAGSGRITWQEQMFDAAASSA